MNDPWSKATAVYAPELTADPKEFVAVWESQGTLVYCTFKRHGAALAVSKVEIETESGSVAAWARRVPSDGLLVGAVRRCGNSGLTAIAALLGEYERLSQAYLAALEVVLQEQDIVPNSGVERALVTALKAYDKDLKGRPSAEVQNQVTQVRAWLDQEVQTKEIVNRLQAMGLSESTAFRRLKKARDD